LFHLPDQLIICCFATDFFFLIINTHPISGHVKLTDRVIKDYDFANVF